ncbi:MAG TPA: ABC transporter substrate-binding protein, partial [Deinococcales bacterium]|nr:ABC transporter substrate-binding protein [Deinococcales bacterium]
PFENLEVIARITGTEERAGELAAQLRAELASAAEAAEALEYTPRVLFLYLGSTQMQFAGGVDVPSNLMITAAGGVDAGAEAGFTGYQPFTPEAVVVAEPDVLLITQRGLDAMGDVDAVFEIQGIAETPAGLNRNIIVFDDNYLLTFGLRTGEALQDLTAELAKLQP